MGRSISIADLASSVVDNGRRGEPKPGCDCVQCFGYCIVDRDEAFRQQCAEQSKLARKSYNAPLDFVA